MFAEQRAGAFLVYGSWRIRHNDPLAPDATDEQLEKLRKSTEQYCVVYQTLAGKPELQTEWA